MKTLSTSWLWFRARRCALDMLDDRSGIAATEFAVIVPIMLVMFFGMVEFSSGVAVDRKVTLMARTMSDLVSRSKKVDDTAMTNFFAATNAIMTPYSSTPARTTITEVYIDPATGGARAQWSNASNGATARAAGSPVTVPDNLIARDPVTKAILPNQYLIFSEVSYLYTPTIGYVMATAGVTLRDVAYTRPRLSLCVLYNPSNPPPPCPTL
jgi:Flp pilus assembly protein TadG